MEGGQTKLNNGLVIGVFISIVVLVLFAGLFFKGVSKDSDQPQAILAGQIVNIEIVEGEEDLARGLSDHNVLGENNGMLFLLDGYYLPGIWMKDMDFAIDIIFIRDDVVVSYDKNAQPETGDNLTVYKPKTFVNRVLEVNSGFIDKYNLKIGDKVKFKNIDKNNNKVLEY
jgi:uncharacterized membrane protein (UPF0127 family)